MLWMCVSCLTQSEHLSADRHAIIFITITLSYLVLRTLGPVLFEPSHCPAPEAGRVCTTSRSWRWRPAAPADREAEPMSSSLPCRATHGNEVLSLKNVLPLTSRVPLAQ